MLVCIHEAIHTKLDSKITYWMLIQVYGEIKYLIILHIQDRSWDAHMQRTFIMHMIEIDIELAAL